MAYRRSIIAGASEDRLERLIEARLAPAPTRKTSTRGMGPFRRGVVRDVHRSFGLFARCREIRIIHFLQTIYESDAFSSHNRDHDGILLKVEGDSFLVIFRNVRKALQAAVTCSARAEGI
jgi:hypothetical protein